MPLRLRWILPLIQTIVTILLLAAARWERPISAWDVPAVMLGKALSAPALVLPYAGAHVFHAAGIRTNPVTDNILFLSGVGAVWYVVGWTIDSRNRKTRRRHARAMRAIAYVCCVGLAVFLLIGAIPLWQRVRWSYAVTAAIVAALQIGWGCVLAVFGIHGIWSIAQATALL